MFGFGTGEIIVLAVVVLLLFGRRIPDVMKSLGKSVPAFRKGLGEET
jgi:sec-independent protein translocase protein TatA